MRNKKVTAALLAAALALQAAGMAVRTAGRLFRTGCVLGWLMQEAFYEIK